MVGWLFAAALSETVVSATAAGPQSYEVFGDRYHVLDSAEGYVERGASLRGMAPRSTATRRPAASASTCTR